MLFVTSVSYCLAEDLGVIPTPRKVEFTREYFQLVKLPLIRTGHGGGDMHLLDKIFKNPNIFDLYKHLAGTRDGAMSILVGTAAWKSIEEQRLVKISELKDIPVNPNRG
ncbi:hypothetical protein D1164_17425 [Mariniphaga sediminis]|uniref:Uncharacterized protein n=2 Tax=Mariniphaga sediminis TaxID=1628158 RepID=A0A399CWS7_9BACT|nr:hypothetical protein D1164_17425 [Mariniphaga sediminis]